jgi:CRP-like cAMP-binding protein
LKHRLYAEILRLSQPRAGHEGERVITPPPYHHILAARIGCRREQVTRELSRMEKQGFVIRNRGGLVILQANDLQARLNKVLRDDA